MATWARCLPPPPTPDRPTLRPGWSRSPYSRCHPLTYPELAHHQRCQPPEVVSPDDTSPIEADTLQGLDGLEEVAQSLLFLSDGLVPPLV
jgi:hypothetical protein